DPSNAELKAKRPNPDLLYPGDIINIPDKEEQPSPMAQGTANGYAADIPKVKITLVFVNDGQPMASEPFTVEGLDPTDGTTDGSGSADFDVPVIVKEFTVKFTKQPYAYKVMVANIDPVTEDSGVLQRLVNLGYFRRASDREDAEAFAGAVAAYQREKGMTVTG